MFIKEGISRAAADRLDAGCGPAHPGQPAQGGRRSGRSRRRRADRIRRARVEDGSGSAGRPRRHLQFALADLRAEVGDDCVIMADLCLCEYTDHGHCGVLAEDGYVINDATLERYAATAVAQAEAGAAPGRAERDDGRPGGGDPGGAGRRGSRRRRHLRLLGQVRVRFCGPFREAAEGRPRSPTGPATSRTGQRGRGAPRGGARYRRGRRHGDGQPALAYLDVIRRVADSVTVPVAAYQVSGEFAMVEAAAANGWLDRDR